MRETNPLQPTVLEADKPFLARLWIYQAERFPIFQHGLMIVTFTFSAIAYCRICRGQTDFVTLPDFAVGAMTSFGFFLLLRLLDEFKDAKEDAAFRPYRPVPRGLVKLKELGWLAVGVVLLQVAINWFVLPKMLWAYGIGLGFIAVMTKEFFVSKWLKSHPIVYMLSHMAVMPVIDFYTTGLDWINAGAKAPEGLLFFLLVTFLNGLVIEIGRKIRAEEAEEQGVETYSFLWGAKKATVVWLGLLVLTFVIANLASYFAGFGNQAILGFVGLLVGCAMPALKFLKTNAQPDAKKIELAAGIWTIGMYLTLGAVPMLIALFKGGS
jgi:4-hydroxybenzoate polyprenyltransferase